MVFVVSCRSYWLKMSGFILSLLPFLAMGLDNKADIDLMGVKPAQENEASLLSLTSCAPIKSSCQDSGKCPSFEIVRKLHTISSDNIKSPNEIENFANLKKILRGKHLRIRSAKGWFHVAGFFSYPMYVMNQLLFAEKMGLIGDKKPFVYMPESHHYFDSCQKRGGGDAAENFWTRWFKPISEVDESELSEDDVWEFSQFSIENIHHNKDAIHSYPYRLNNTLLQGEAGTKQWATCHRARALPLLEQYLEVNDDVVDEAQSFYSRRFSSSQGNVMGIHMRGTDKWINPQVGPDRYHGEIDSFLRTNPNSQIFLATDDPGFLEKTRTEYGFAMVSRNVMREKGNVIFDDEIDKDRKSREVLVDSLVLSMGNKLVKSWSAVSEFAVYFHMLMQPDRRLHVVDLQLNNKAATDETSNCKEFVPLVAIRNIVAEKPSNNDLSKAQNLLGSAG
eukprot:jgi/Bigna1/130975/aug1.13_g5683